MPPVFRAGHTSARMRCCRPLHRATVSSDHSLRAAASFLNRPEPLHGASMTITSKYPSILPKSRGSLQVTQLFIYPQRSAFSSSIDARDLITSLDTSKLSFDNNDASNVVLPPGAAQRSRTRTGVSEEITELYTWCRNIDEASCT